MFLGYVSMQVPSNIFLTQLRPSVYLPAVMAIWGLLSTLTGLTRNAWQLYTIRFLLGFSESAFYRKFNCLSTTPVLSVFPIPILFSVIAGALFLLSSWYKRKELGVRSAILYSGSQLGSAFSGLISGAVQQGLAGAGGLESWRWIFIVDGTLTLAVAFGAAFVLPDYPSTTSWISSTERTVALERMTADAGQPDDSSENWRSGFGLALRDRRVYIFALTFLCIQVTSATSNYFPSVVQTLGFTKTHTLLLTAPPYLVAMIISIGNNRSADCRRNSSFHIIWPLALAVLGFVLGALSLHTRVRYFAMVLMITGGQGSNAVLLAWTQKTILRPRIKRASAVAFVNAVGNLAQVRRLLVMFTHPFELPCDQALKPQKSI
jgi:Major Facilitator Superfamily